MCEEEQIKIALLLFWNAQPTQRYMGRLEKWISFHWAYLEKYTAPYNEMKKIAEESLISLLCEHIPQ